MNTFTILLALVSAAYSVQGRSRPHLPIDPIEDVCELHEQPRYEEREFDRYHGSSSRDKLLGQFTDREDLRNELMREITLRKILAAAKKRGYLKYREQDSEELFRPLQHNILEPKRVVRVEVKRTPSGRYTRKPAISSGLVEALSELELSDLRNRKRKRISKHVLSAEDYEDDDNNVDNINKNINSISTIRERPRAKTAPTEVSPPASGNDSPSVVLSIYNDETDDEAAMDSDDVISDENAEDSEIQDTDEDVQEIPSHGNGNNIDVESTASQDVAKSSQLEDTEAENILTTLEPIKIVSTIAPEVGTTDILPANIDGKKSKKSRKVKNHKRHGKKTKTHSEQQQHNHPSPAKDEESKDDEVTENEQEAETNVINDDSYGTKTSDVEMNDESKAKARDDSSVEEQLSENHDGNLKVNDQEEELKVIPKGSRTIGWKTLVRPLDRDDSDESSSVSRREDGKHRRRRHRNSNINVNKNIHETHHDHRFLNRRSFSTPTGSDYRVGGLVGSKTGRSKRNRHGNRNLNHNVNINRINHKVRGLKTTKIVRKGGVHGADGLPKSRRSFNQNVNINRNVHRSSHRHTPHRGERKGDTKVNQSDIDNILKEVSRLRKQIAEKEEQEKVVENADGYIQN